MLIAMATALGHVLIQWAIHVSANVFVIAPSGIQIPRTLVRLQAHYPWQLHLSDEEGVVEIIHRGKDGRGVDFAVLDNHSNPMDRPLDFCAPTGMLIDVGRAKNNDLLDRFKGRSHCQVNLDVRLPFL
jgi:NADPH:quinone reductase-like Zn-dependent oxidoreductase